MRGALQAYLPLELSLAEEAWTSLPSSKMKRPNRSDPFAWCYTYTGFSLTFAHATLHQFGARAGSTILDPFVGSGTTLMAAALRNCVAVGVDISPFSALLSRARVATLVDPKRAIQYLIIKEDRKGNTDQSPHHSGFQVLHPHHEAYAAAVVSKVCKNLDMAPHDFWSALLADDVGRYDSEAVAMLSLSLGARDCAHLISRKQSNMVQKSS